MNFSTSIDRRRFLRNASCGFGGIALHSLLHGAGGMGLTHLPKAKRVIFLFMRGGPSQMDTFDYKPLLQRDHDKDAVIPALQKAQGRKLGKLLKSPFAWKQHGGGGLWISDLFPHLSTHSDELCVVKSLHTEGFDHGQAILRLHTGESTLTRPSIGSWVAYGLGSENDNLPGFVSISPSKSVIGTRGFANVFLPASSQGMPIGREGIAARSATVPHLGDAGPEARLLLDRLGQRNRGHLETAGEDPRLSGQIDNFELAFRMQMEAPEILDIESESAATKALYGIGEKATDDFGRQCLMARRLSEAGVRFVQITHQHKETNIPYWDQHSHLEDGLKENAARVDLPIAGLLSDLRRRGLLEDTLVWWGGEFGRTPVREFRNKSIGRDHNPLGFTQWLAGAGVKGGFSHGETDEYGYRAALDKVHMHDMHATILHLLGIDHEKLTYRYAGRDFRLTDVYGEVVSNLIA